MATPLQKRLGPVTLPPTPKSGRTPAETQQNINIWTRQVEQTFRQFERALTTLTSSDIPESLTGGGVSGGSGVPDSPGGLFWTQARFDNAFSHKTTDDLAEGVTNLYFTTARARASISVTAPLSYNSSTGVMSLATPLSVAFGGTATTNRTLLDNSPALSVDWQNRTLADTGGQPTVYWGSRVLSDSGNTASLHWENRQLYDAGAFNISVDWGARQLVDSTGAVALDWSTTGALSLSSPLAATSGGTGQSAVTTGDLLYGSASNTWSRLADVATGNALISGGIATAPSWGKIGLTTHVSGTLPVANGGTNITSYTTGDLIYASGSTTLSKLADVATGNALISGGVGTAPSWGKIGLTTHVSGTLAVGNGGTGATSFTAGQVLYGNGSSALSTSANFTWDNTNRKLSLGSGVTTGLLAFSATLGQKINIYDSGIASDFHGILLNPGIMGFRVPSSGHAFEFYNFDSATENLIFHLGGDGNIVVYNGVSSVSGTDLIFSTQDYGNEIFRLNGSGQVLSNASSASTAFLNLAAGDGTFAPLSFITGTLLSSPVDGTMEYDGTDLYFTIGSTRFTISVFDGGGAS